MTIIRVLIAANTRIGALAKRLARMSAKVSLPRLRMRSANSMVITG